MEATHNIALGVGQGNLQAAAKFYEEQMAMVRGEAGDNWIEMRSGPLRLYLVDDQLGTPTFEMLVEDVNAAMEQLLAAGSEEAILDGSPKERYVKTPFGHYFCISPE